jgi:YD repeat-containing protein
LTQYSYDADGRPTSVGRARDNSAPPQTTTATYNQAGKVSSLTDPDNRNSLHWQNLL